MTWINDGNTSGSRNVPFTFIELFAGIGGARIALQSIGGRCVFSSEINPEARRIYQENFGEEPLGDIKLIDKQNIPDHDFLVSPIPLNSVSAASKQTDNDDLFKEVLSIIEAKKPKAFLLYGPPGMGKRIHVVNALDKLGTGYNLHYEVVNVGRILPQKKSLSIIVGLVDEGFRFPEIKDRRPILKDVLERYVSPKYTLSDARWGKVSEKIKIQEDGKALRNSMWCEVVDENSVLSRPVHPDNINRIFVYQGEDRNPRSFTPREYARLMGFPDSFEIPVGDGQAYKLFAYSAVVPVVRTIADELINRIQKKSITGRYLERRTEQWFKKEFGYNDVDTRVMVTDGVVKNPWQIDVVAWKKTGSPFGGKIHVWVECKSRPVSRKKVSRDIINGFLGVARLINKNPDALIPDILMVVTDTVFNEGAVDLGNNHDIYLVEVDKAGFRFVGDLSRDDFKGHRKSKY